MDLGGKWYINRKQQFVDNERLSFQAFLDKIESGECFPENEDLAKRVIDILKQKYNLIF
jgi:hypothetical protein